MSILDKDIKLLWGRAAGMCSYPLCDLDLIPFLNLPETFSIGEMAHVVARSPKGKRGGSSRGNNTYENLILLCPTHHTLIDKSPEGTFSVETILDWKARHEQRVKTAVNARTFDNLRELKLFVSDVLIENKHIWSIFGPESSVAKQNPLSSTALIWNLRKLDTIIPNNKRLIQALERNLTLLSEEQKLAFFHFKQHAQGFEQNAYGRLDSYPKFPTEFEQEFKNE